MLLPSLVTGGDFGLTSFGLGMYRMFSLGLMTPQKKMFMRGVDGGSENVNVTTLALNNLLVKLGIFKSIQQHRLPPDHSHRWTTDGLFSVLEGWLTKDGFKGCKSVWEIVEYLRSQFAKADGYKEKQARKISSPPPCHTPARHRTPSPYTPPGRLRRAPATAHAHSHPPTPLPIGGNLFPPH